MRLAAIAHGLPDAVLVTGHALLRYIPRDAEQPMSPARVQDLADERGCDPRTIRAHIRRLEAYGLVVDRSAGGGRRMIQRRRGRIVVLQGIDFSPMLAAAETLGVAALAAEAGLDERRRIAARISEMKRQLRDAVAERPDEEAAARISAVLEACPARHRTLAFRELAALAALLKIAARLLMDTDDRTGSRILSPDRDNEFIRPYTTEKDENPACKAPIAGGAGAADTLKHLSLDMLTAALVQLAHPHREERPGELVEHRRHGL
jgi:hypothetical protein